MTDGTQLHKVDVYTGKGFILLIEELSEQNLKNRVYRELVDRVVCETFSLYVINIF